MPLLACFLVCLFCEFQHKNQVQKEKVEVLHGTVDHRKAELSALPAQGWLYQPQNSQDVINAEKEEMLG